MDGILVLTAFVIALLIFAYNRALPNPYPGIPYNHASAKRISGDLPELLAHFSKTKEVASFSFGQCAKLDSPVVQLFLKPFLKPFIIVDDSHETEDIMLRRSHEFDRAPSTILFFKPLIPHATLVMPSDATFKEQRRLWMDSMTPSFLRNVVAPQIYTSALDLVHLWRTKISMAQNRPFAAQHDIHVAAFDAIWGAILGSELGGMRAELKVIESATSSTLLVDDAGQAVRFTSAPASEMYKAMLYLNNTVDRIMASPFPKWHHWIIRQGPWFRAAKAVKDRQVQQLIRQARARFEKISNSEAGDFLDTCAMDMVLRRDVLAAEKAGIPYDDKRRPDIEDELLMLLVAGHETTATTLSWTVKLLTNNPEKQMKLREALKSAFPNATAVSPPTAAEILGSNIPYLDGFLEECNRHANTVPLLVRVATVDTRILGFNIPKGATVMCNAQFMSQPQQVSENVRSSSSQAALKKRGRDYATDDIEAFMPERWLVSNAQGEETFDAYALTRMSFSQGPRGCFGKRLAMQELRVMVVLLVLNFDFQPIPEGLNSPQGQQKVLRHPQQCFVRLAELA